MSAHINFHLLLDQYLHCALTPSGLHGVLAYPFIHFCVLLSDGTPGLAALERSGGSSWQAGATVGPGDGYFRRQHGGDTFTWLSAGHVFSPMLARPVVQLCEKKEMHWVAILSKLLLLFTVKVYSFHRSYLIWPINETSTGVTKRRCFCHVLIRLRHYLTKYFRIHFQLMYCFYFKLLWIMWIKWTLEAIHLTMCSITI